MSRVGNTLINMPDGVKLERTDSGLRIIGLKGQLEIKNIKGVIVHQDGSNLKVSVDKESGKLKAIHGTYRSLISNMVHGVSEGWSKELELVGTGYRAEFNDNKLILYIGYSHPVEIKTPEGITFKVDKTKITIEGIDKELVGLIASKIRDIRPPEPYKGKGIKYKDEVVRRKPGKAAKAQAGA